MGPRAGAAGCSFGDGDVTGLEVAEGRVRLVRWLDDAGRAASEPLSGAFPLRELFARLGGAAREG